MERREPVPSAFLRDLIGDLDGILKIAPVLDDFHAECAHRRVFVNAVSVWYHHGRRDTVLPGREPNGLAVIASCCRHDTGWLSSFAQNAVEVNETSAHLEGPGRRVILVFHPDGRTDSRLEKRPPVLRGGGHRLVD